MPFQSLLELPEPSTPEHGVHVVDDGFLRLENLAFQQINDLSLTVVLAFFKAIDGYGCSVLAPRILGSRNACLCVHSNGPQRPHTS